MYLIRLNNTDCPAAAMPATVEVVPARPTATNMLGAPVGALGYPRAVLHFDLLSLTGFQWWLAWIGAGTVSVTLTGVVLPSPYATGTYIHPVTSDPYPNHANYSSGILHLPETADGVGMQTRFVSGVSANWVAGAFTIQITELGR